MGWLVALPALGNRPERGAGACILQCTNTYTFASVFPCLLCFLFRPLLFPYGSKHPSKMHSRNLLISQSVRGTVSH
jgi:hypothetical protein